MSDIRETSTAIAAREADEFFGWLVKQKNAIRQVLPTHLATDEGVRRVLRVIYDEVRRTPKLRQTSADSMLSAIISACQLGLEFGGVKGHAYVLPYAQTATLIIGYKGYCDLALRSGEVTRISASPIFADEIERGLFMADLGTGEISHKWAPPPRGIEREMVGAYAVAGIRNGGNAVRILSMDEIDARRQRGANRKGGPWETDFEAMARKSALRALFTGGTVPLSAELAHGLSVDGDRDEMEGEVVRREIAATSAPATRQIAEQEPERMPEPTREPEPVRVEAPKEQPKAKAPTRSAAPPPAVGDEAKLRSEIAEMESEMSADRIDAIRLRMGWPVNAPVPAGVPVSDLRTYRTHLNAAIDDQANR